MAKKKKISSSKKSLSTAELDNLINSPERKKYFFHFMGQRFEGEEIKRQGTKQNSRVLLSLANGVSRWFRLKDINPL